MVFCVAFPLTLSIILSHILCHTQPNSILKSQIRIIFHSGWLAWKITHPHQCCGRILVGCGTLTHQWFSEAVQACHCELSQSSICHNHKNKTSTTAPWPMDSNHSNDNNICTSILWCMCLFFHDCGIITMTIPHCTLTTFSIFHTNQFPPIIVAHLFGSTPQNLPRHTPLHAVTVKLLGQLPLLLNWHSTWHTHHFLFFT